MSGNSYEYKALWLGGGDRPGDDFNKRINEHVREGWSVLHGSFTGTSILLVRLVD